MGFSVWHALVVLVVVLVLFGAGKLPKVMGDLGKGIRAFRHGMQEGENGGEEPKKLAGPTDPDPPKQP